jgi:hypothetical protein
MNNEPENTTNEKSLSNLEDAKINRDIPQEFEEIKIIIKKERQILQDFIDENKLLKDKLSSTVESNIFLLFLCLLFDNRFVTFMFILLSL